MAMGIDAGTAARERGEETLTAERARLVRLCTRLTGDAGVAEDLAQETLLAAFQHEQALRDPTKRAQWLSGIARNLCLHWGRRKGLERARSTYPRPYDDASPSDEADARADDVDLEGDLERGELADLLDRALALLPPDTRAALVQRYVHASPHAEVAARLGVSEEAAKKRVERGAMALKRVLATDLRQEALTYGLICPGATGTDGWRETRLWCPGCGRRKLEGLLRPDEGELFMRCPACSSPYADVFPYANYISSHLGDGLRGLRTYKPAVSRVLDVIDDLFRSRWLDGGVVCGGCGERLPITRGIPPALAPLFGHSRPGPDAIYIWCPRCDFVDVETWHSLTWSLPAARRFWREHPRMRFLPAREIDIAGSPAVLTGLESVTGGARLEVVTLRDTYQVVGIDGAHEENAHE